MSQVGSIRLEIEGEEEDEELVEVVLETSTVSHIVEIKG